MYTKKDRIQLMQNVSANFRDLMDILLSYKIKYCVGVGMYRLRAFFILSAHHYQFLLPQLK